jgi:hypothetical protein
MEVQDCWHQMCAACILALCYHNKSNLELNSASSNLVLKSMVTTKESYSTEKFSAWMLLTGTFSDDESYNLVVGLLIGQKLDDSPLEYWDMMMKSGYTPSPSVFAVYNQACVSSGRWDTLTSIIEKCKTSDKIKVWCPQWARCISIAGAAFAANISKLFLCALEFLARWIAHGIGAGAGLVTDGLGAVSSDNFAIRLWDPGGHVKNNLGTSCISSGGECQPPPHKDSRRPSNKGGAVANVSNKQSSDEKGTYQEQSSRAGMPASVIVGERRHTRLVGRVEMLGRVVELAIC